MAFESLTYRVLIASPSDLEEERQVATNVINEWNAQHASTENVVLIPIKWETHAMPETGERPQSSINKQLVKTSDVVIGMFWHRFGSDTGVAASGTVEEIDQFVASRRLAMLYFSNRMVSPSKIDPKQLSQLRDFKEQTYKKALVGRFESIAELEKTLARDLTLMVHALKARRRRGASNRFDNMLKVTEVIRAHKQHNISLDEIQQYEKALGLRRPANNVSTDPIKPGEVGPNGFPVGYDEEGNKVEWIQDEDVEEGVWPMILRRSDKSISSAHTEFWDKVWWNRKQNLIWELEQEEPLSEETKAKIAEIKKNCRKVERKYGKRNLGWDDFEWGLLSGKLAALAWLGGAEWNESLDT